MSTAKLEIAGLEKRYGPVTALRPTSIGVAKGEFLTLLGPSGSGKTTLLMMIAGLTEPSGGEIRLNGVDISGLPAFKRNIGVIFQNYALFPHLPVFENVAFGLRMRRLAKAEIETRVARALERVQLSGFERRMPRELSGGQQQRVAFARAIVFEPDLILMDEPLGALDKKLRDELKLEIRKLHRDLGTTVIYVTHDQDEAMLLSDRICLMNQARVEQIGTPAELYGEPRTRFTATFLGESNLLSGISDGSGVLAGGLRLETGHGAKLPAVGAPCTVLIRPERIRIASGGAQPNGISARVETVIHLGAISRLVLGLSGTDTLIMMMLGGPDVPAAGDTVTVAIAPADVVPLQVGG